MTKKSATRMCIACRGREDQKILRRLRLAGGRLVIDDAGRLSGRSAYVHGTVSCLSKIGDVKKLAYALRHPVQAFSREELTLLGVELRRSSGQSGAL